MSAGITPGAPLSSAKFGKKARACSADRSLYNQEGLGGDRRFHPGRETRAVPVMDGILTFLQQLATPRERDGLTDQELLRRFSRERDENAFVMLLRRHGPLVLRACRAILPSSHDAEDVFQAVFLILAR